MCPGGGRRLNMGGFYFFIWLMNLGRKIRMPKASKRYVPRPVME